MNLVINGGLINKTQNAANLDDLAREKERLELVKGKIVADVANLGKVTVDNYVAELIEEGISVEAEVTDNGDGSKTVITDTGYSVTIVPKGDRDVEIIIDGKVGALPPRIVRIETTTTTSSFTAKAQVLRVNGGTIRYYYKLATESNDKYREITNITEEKGAEVTGLVAGMSYDVKVVAENVNGPVEQKAKVIVKALTVANLKGEDILANTTTIKDELENQVVVPKGFKIAEDSGNTVKEGVVVEDHIGNQFVWIPVSNINGNGTGKIKINSKEEEGTEITLGRYTFDSDTGTEIKVQNGSEYAATTVQAVSEGTVDKYAIEAGDGKVYDISESRLGNRVTGSNSLNTTAKNLKGFVESVRDNHGYYLGRYEAGSKDAETIVSKPNYNSVSRIGQPASAELARKMYEGNSEVGVDSDLCNGYAWDTALVYIQNMGHANYSNLVLQVRDQLQDEKCKIYGMGASLFEYTTEFIEANRNDGYNCVARGCMYLISSRLNWRRAQAGMAGDDSIYGFRVVLYII